MPATSTETPARFASPKRANATGKADSNSPKPEPTILFQKFFKSVGPRTYAAQVKEASTGNHFIVLTEGKRDPKTDEVRKTRLFVFSEDFPEFFRLIKATAEFVKDHPVPEEVKKRQEEYWSNQSNPKSRRPRGTR
jgi:hypothetical protein